MSKALALYKASDGTAATAATVDLVSAWVATKTGQPVSFQATYGATCVGVWKVQGTNAEPPLYNSSASTLDESCYWSTPTQPNGSAGETSITVSATHDYMRFFYDRTSGGTGVLPVCRVALGAGGVLVMPATVADLNKLVDALS
jgi:hypothetical protein